MVVDHFREIGRYNYGYALVDQALWKKFHLSELVYRINRRRKIQFSWSIVVQLMSAERINEPCSKRQSSFNQCEYIGFGQKSIDLHHFYRSLDVLSEEEAYVKQHLYSQKSSLFSSMLDVVFYDVTTIYFDSQVEKQGELRQKGYSKDGKAHKTQILLGLLVDKLRNPITYEVYAGNTYEGATLIDALQQMKSRYQIDKVVVVTDSAMINKDNRKYLTKNNIDYILGDRIKSLGSV